MYKRRNTVADLFILAFLGHLVGDFLLQPKWMALRKSEKSRDGRLICTVHVAIYTLSVCALMWTFDPLIIVLIAVPHWIIDHWSLANKWLGLIGGRTFEAAFASKDENREFDIAFTCIVYAETDAALHFLCLWALIQFVMI